jgi:ATP-binding cassette subfamily C (CFTR/MRP) protein 1
MTMMRGVLISSIFSKTLKLSTDADSESRAMTLMIADVEGVMGSVKHLNEVWVSLIETALATWLLERQVGLASLSMIALVLGAFSLAYPNMAT